MYDTVLNHGQGKGWNEAKTTYLICRINWIISTYTYLILEIIPGGRGNKHAEKKLIEDPFFKSDEHSLSLANKVFSLSLSVSACV